MPLSFASILKAIFLRKEPLSSLFLIIAIRYWNYRWFPGKGLRSEGKNPTNDSGIGEQTEDLEIEILDFQFKRINYLQYVQHQAYERMKSERFRIADKFRSEGQGEASRINGEKERELKKIQSLAFRDAEMIKGQAHYQSNQSRGLYCFLNSRKIFEKIIDGTTYSYQ